MGSSGDQVIVGITGRAGAGKDTASEGLRRLGFRTMRFSDALKDGLAAMLGVPRSRIEDWPGKEEVLPGVGYTPRYLMQTLGTEWGRDTIHPDLWVRITMARAAGIPRVVIPDVRFDNEAQAIVDRGGLVIRVWRNGTEPGPAHASEAGVSERLVSSTVLNNDTPRTLRSVVRWLVKGSFDGMDETEGAEHAPSSEGGSESAGGRGGVPEGGGEGRHHVGGRRRVPGLGGFDR